MFTTIKTRATALAVGLVATVLLAGPAAAEPKPAASFYTQQQLEAMSSSWAAKGRLLGHADSFYTRQQLEAMSSSWAAKGHLLR
jgi:hypothetical protein